MFLEVADAAVDDGAGGEGVDGAGGHEAAVEGVEGVGGAGDEDDGVGGDGVDLKSVGKAEVGQMGVSLGYFGVSR